MPVTSHEAVIRETEGDLNETLGRVRHIITRGRWWILVPASGIALATMAFLSLLPNQDTSEATLLVVQQQVPPALCHSHDYDGYGVRASSHDTGGLIP
jgi:hypothetical protein